MQRLVKSAAQMEIAMSLHNEIMNLHCTVPEAASAWPNYGVGYKAGNRDARHAAAEAALKADAEIERLRSALCEIANADMTTKGFQMMASEALAGGPVAFGAA